MIQVLTYIAIGEVLLVGNAQETTCLAYRLFLTVLPSHVEWKYCQLIHIIMKTTTTYDLATTNALVVVSAKEHGKVYQLKDGSLTALNYTAEHPPTYSDDERFFMRSGDGAFLGAGYVKEEDDERNLERYFKAISGELSELLKEHNPSVVFVLEPEHLKGHIEQRLVNPTHIPVEVVAYGNHVESEPSEILSVIKSAVSQESDPTDPASVAGEENAEEKRKILEVGKQVSG